MIILEIRENGGGRLLGWIGINEADFQTAAFQPRVVKGEVVLKAYTEKRTEFVSRGKETFGTDTLPGLKDA